MPHPPRKPSRATASPPPLARAYRDLDRWLRQRLADQGADVSALPAQVDLRVTIPIRLRGEGRHAAEERFTHQLETEAQRLWERLELEQFGHRTGHVFCLWCKAPLCEHSAPPDVRSVFEGYASTGQPRWREFTSFVVARRDPRVDRLFGDRSLPLAVYQPGEELVAELLPAYRIDGHRILAQVVAGLFALPRPAGGNERGLALTIQLLEQARVSGEPAVWLNLVAQPPAPHHLPTLLSEGVSRPLSRFVSSVRHELHLVQQELDDARRQGRRPARTEVRARARRVLERAPALLEKLVRQHGRRTLHAEARTLDPERPTASALRDARTAPDEQLLHDRSQDTVIVRGPRNRVHVFRDDGVHITSVVYPGETIRDRLRSGRWAPLDASRTAAFRAHLAERPPDGSGAGEDEIAG